MKFFIKVVVSGIVFFMILKSCGPFPGKVNSLIGQPAPDFILETLDGTKESMSRFRDGQPAVIFFWATWCPHCRTQLKVLAQKRDEIKEKGIKMILVDTGESPQMVRTYMDAHNIPFNVFLDQDAAVAGNYHVAGIPTFFFLDKEGIVAAAEHFIPENYEEILLGQVP